MPRLPADPVGVALRTAMRVRSPPTKTDAHIIFSTALAPGRVARPRGRRPMRSSPSQSVAHDRDDHLRRNPHAASGASASGVIRNNPTRQRKQPFDRDAYRLRTVIEKTFPCRKDLGRVATRCERLARNIRTAVIIARPRIILAMRPEPQGYGPSRDRIM